MDVQHRPAEVEQVCGDAVRERPGVGVDGAVDGDTGDTRAGGETSRARSASRACRAPGVTGSICGLRRPAVRLTSEADGLVTDEPSGKSTVGTVWLPLLTVRHEVGRVGVAARC